MNAMDLRHLKLNDVLGAVGLQRRSRPMEMVLPAMGLFAAGVAVGCGIGLMLAPKSGAQLRQQLVGKVTGKEMPQKVFEQQTV